MPDFQIVLKTLADLTGISQTDEGLQKLAQQALNVAASAGQAGAETGRFVDAAGKLREANGQFVATGTSAQEAGKKIGEASHEADHFVESLKAGVSIDIGHRIVEGIAEIPRAFQEALAEGVRFNAEMETLGIQLGGALRSANPGQYLNFSEARAAGEQTLDILRVKANELGTNFQALSETFAINAPLLSHAGIKGIQDQIDTIILLNQVAQAHGVSGFQAQRDIIDILNGNGNRTQLGRELESNGVTNESIKQAEQMGTLMDLLHEKLGAYGEAGKAAADTFTAAQQRLANETEQLYGAMSKPVFDELKAAYDTLAAEIVKPEVTQALQSLGIAVAGVVDVGAGLVEFAVRNAGVLVPLGEVIGVVTFALAAYKTAQLASIIGGRLTALVAETVATGAQTAAIVEQTVAVEANTAAKAAGGVGIGVGIGGGIAAGATALAGGYLVGSAIRASEDKAEDEDREQTGTQLDADTNKTLGLQKDITNATTVEDQLKKRKDLTDQLADAQKRLKEMQDDAVSHPAHWLSDEAVARFDNLKNTIVEIQRVIEQVNRTTPEVAAQFAAASAQAKTDASDDQAQERYDQSPEGRLEKAEAAGDQGGIDDAKYDAGVAKRVPKLEKEFGFSPDKAEQTAQDQESAAEDSKEHEKDAKDEESLRKRAQAEADAWTEKDQKETQAEEKKAAADRQKAADDAKQRADAIASVNDQIAINRALAQGDTAGAAALEKKRDIQNEITRLMKEGLSYQEASAKATEDVNTANDAQDKKDADRASARGARGGRDGSFTIQGYRDPVHDAPGQMHTGRLGTETLDGKPSPDRFANAPDATQAALDAAPTARGALDAAPTARGALDAAPTYVPTDYTNLNLSPGDMVGAIIAKYQGQAASTSGPTSAAGGDSGLGGLTASANNAKSATDGLGGLQGQIQSTTQALTGLAGSLAKIDLKGSFTDFQSQLDTLNTTVNDLLANN